ncbi:hypothetical protein FGIG_05109 [Fasciola gigantica]|uniref:Uncharacterized protein n=1 Tax=Fasciola gigantica TaxID=46835 RepID=A0A504YA24_FASGI|nr:hypothetical protein FGIG_05109 [Fasciola gigantica]
MPFKREWRKFERKATAACKKAINEIIRRSPSPERRRTPPPLPKPEVTSSVNKDVTQSSGTLPESTKPSEIPSSSFAATESKKPTAENNLCTTALSITEQSDRDIHPRNSATSEIKPDLQSECAELKAQANDSGFEGSKECVETTGFANENHREMKDLVEEDKLDLVIRPASMEKEPEIQTEKDQEKCTIGEQMKRTAAESKEEISTDVLMRFNILDISAHSDEVEPTNSLKNIPGGMALLKLIGTIRLAIANYKLNDGNQRRVYAEHTRKFCDCACQIMMKLGKGKGEILLDTEYLIALKQIVQQTTLFHEKNITSIQQCSDDVFQLLEQMQQSLRQELRIPFGTEEATTRTRLVQMKRATADCLSKSLFQLEAVARYTTEINNWLLEYERFLEERITVIQCVGRPADDDDQTEHKELDQVKKLTPQILNTYSNLNHQCLNAMDLLQNELSSYGQTLSS